LRELSARNVAIHVVWVAVLADDSLEATSTAAAMFPDDLEAMHYWGGELQVSKAFHATLGLERWKRNVAWDLYLLYGACPNGTSQPPVPSLWMQQLRPEDVPELDGSLLVGHLSELLGQQRRASSGLAVTSEDSATRSAVAVRTAEEQNCVVPSGQTPEPL
jgi:hypothetical protein